MARPALMVSTASASDRLEDADAQALQDRGDACPIGNCQGLVSPKSPRMVTMAGRKAAGDDQEANMLIVLPTPLDCKDGRSPAEPGSGGYGHRLFLGGRRHGADVVIRFAEADQCFQSPVGNIADLTYAMRLEGGVCTLAPRC